MTFSDSRISKFLQENFIVQWEAVSPVRVVKFDLGEGRSFSGTVNGEIALYFCDSNGKVFDILPALQSPTITLTRIKEANAFFTGHVGSLSKEMIKDELSSLSAFSRRPMSDEEIEEKIKTFQKIDPQSESLYNHFSYDSGGLHQFAVNKLHRDRLKKIAKERYQTLIAQGVQVVNNPEGIPARLIFPDTKKGEEKRDAYINAAVDDATRDLRTMIYSKVGPAPTHFNDHTFANESLTVVEPGGLGYYQWQIDRAFFGAVDYSENEGGERPFTLPGDPLITPQDWKELVFTTIMKQELKGGVVEYNSESLDAIQIIE